MLTKQGACKRPIISMKLFDLMVQSRLIPHLSSSLLPEPDQTLNWPSIGPNLNGLTKKTDELIGSTEFKWVNQYPARIK